MNKTADRPRDTAVTLASPAAPGLGNALIPHVAPPRAVATITLAELDVLVDKAERLARRWQWIVGIGGGVAVAFLFWASGGKTPIAAFIPLIVLGSINGRGGLRRWAIRRVVDDENVSERDRKRLVREWLSIEDVLKLGGDSRTKELAKRVAVMEPPLEP